MIVRLGLVCQTWSTAETLYCSGLQEGQGLPLKQGFSAWGKHSPLLQHNQGWPSITLLQSRGGSDKQDKQAARRARDEEQMEVQRAVLARRKNDSWRDVRQQRPSELANDFFFLCAAELDLCAASQLTSSRCEAVRDR